MRPVEVREAHVLAIHCVVFLEADDAGDRVCEQGPGIGVDVAREAQHQAPRMFAEALDLRGSGWGDRFAREQRLKPREMRWERPVRGLRRAQYIERRGHHEAGDDRAVFGDLARRGRVPVGCCMIGRKRVAQQGGLVAAPRARQHRAAAVLKHDGGRHDAREHSADTSAPPSRVGSPREGPGAARRDR